VRWDMPERTKHTTLERIGALWCALLHNSPMWPIHGHYQCRTCRRRFPVPWIGVHRLPAP
jgi:hypothetical protein